jgi:hypothetical protein
MRGMTGMKISTTKFEAFFPQRNELCADKPNCKHNTLPRA